MTYRVGNHQPQNIYRNNTYIGVMFSADDAQIVVEALNDADHRACTGDCTGCSGCASIAWMAPQEADAPSTVAAP